MGVKIKKQKAPEIVSEKEKVNLRIIKTVQKKFNLKQKHLEQNEIDADGLKSDCRQFIKNNKLVSKTQQKV